MDRIIEVKVSGNYITKDNKNAGVRGEANVTNLRITFDEGWDGYAKKVTFWDALGNNPTKILIEDKREAIVPIPGEAMTEAGNLTIVIDGYLDGKKQRSISDTFEVKDAPMDENAAEPIDPTPDLATQLQLYIDRCKANLEAHTGDKSNPHKVTAAQVGTYSGSYIEERLKEKANKSDVVKAYRFCGSVNTFDDLPKKYSFIPNGAPYIIADGVKQEVGTYDKETHTVAIEEDIWDFEVVFPIVPITVPKGTYYCDKVELCYYAMIGDNWFNTKLCLPNYGCDYAYTDTEKVIDKVSSYESDGCYAGSTDNLGTLYKALPTWTYEKDEGEGFIRPAADIPDGAYDNGAVYEVKDSGLNYGWNGSTWDALGSEHKDLEAREEIKKLSDSLDCIDISDNNISFNRDKNTVGIIKEIGSFTCTAIDESTNKYTFEVDDTSVFVSYTEYKVRVDDTDYLIRSTTINEGNVVFVAVDDAVPFEVGNTYNIRFETKNATSFGVDNKVYANEGFATGMANFIDETGDQGVANGYKNKLSGKAHFVAGALNEVSEGDRDVVFGEGNIVKGSAKFVEGIGLLAEKTLDGGTVLGTYNEDAQNYIFILGVGTNKNNRKNALVVDKDGNIISYGRLRVDEGVIVGGDVYISGKLEIGNNVNIAGVLKLNESDVVTEAILLKHKGIDIGKSGEGLRSVIFNNINNTSPGYASFTAGSANTTTKDQGATFGYNNINGGYHSLVAGVGNKINEGLTNCVVLGTRLVANADGQIIVGSWNEPNANAKFIIGSGYSSSEKRNSMIVDKWGLIRFYKDITASENLTVKGHVKTPSVHLTSPNGTEFKLTVADDGTLITTKI